MATSVDLGKVLNRAYQGKTVAELGRNSYSALAGALVALANNL